MAHVDKDVYEVMCQLRSSRTNFTQTACEAILKRLSKDCNYEAVDADNHRNEATREAFIAGLLSRL